VTNLQKRRAGLPDFLTRVLVDVLLAHVGAPVLDKLLLNQVDLIECHQDLRYGGHEIRVDDSDEALNAAEEGLLMLLARA
jgi:hypothetical protein